MSATQKVPATFGVWTTYEEFQKGHIPDEVFGKDEYNLAVDYAQGLSQGSKPAMLAVNTTYKGKKNDFARMVAGPRSEFDGAWRPYARVFVTSGVTEISDERAAANQRARNKCFGIFNRKMPLVVQPDQPTLFDAAEEPGYYPPVEMEMTEDLMAVGDTEVQDANDLGSIDVERKEFGDKIVPDTGEPTIEGLRKIIGELRTRNLRQALLMKAHSVPRDTVFVEGAVEEFRKTYEADGDPERWVNAGEVERMIAYQVERARRATRQEMRDDLKLILADTMLEVSRKITEN